MPGAPTPLAGKLGKSTLVALLATLLDEGRDGCLTVTRGAVTRRLFLRDGMIVSGSSTDPQDRLGEILIAQGKLTRADHRRFWELAQAEGRRLGQTLVVNERITTTDLFQGVTAQVVTILDRLQKWRTGDYLFEEERAPEPGTVLLRIPLALYLRAEGKPKAAPKAAPPEKAKPSPAAAKPAGKGGARRKKAAPAAPVAEVTESAAAVAPPTAGVPPDEPTPPPPSAEAEQKIAIEEEGAPCPTPQEAEEQDRIGEVCFLVQELKARVGQDPRALLGVTAGADRDTVQQAYHRMAKLLHADTLPPALPEEIARDAGEVIRAVTAAFRAIEGEAVRRGKAPPATGASHPGFRDPAAVALEQAKGLFQQGREYIGKGNYWQATESLRQAVRLSPRDASYRQYLGLSLLQMKRLHEAEEHLREATRLEPKNPTHLVNLGRIYRAGRLLKKAREAFERALRLDPRNEQAREELRDLPEEEPPGRRDGGSFLKKLFGK